MSNLRLAAIGVAALCGVGLQSGTASAMPMSGLANAASEMATGLEQVRWVCGPYRCWWRPSYYPYGGAYAWGGPRFYARPGWGYYGRPWWRGHYYWRPWGGRGW
jgi:hypothetical protein